MPLDGEKYHLSDGIITLSDWKVIDEKSAMEDSKMSCLISLFNLFLQVRNTNDHIGDLLCHNPEK